MLSSLGKHLRFLLYPEKLAQCQLQSTWSLNSHRFINTSLLFLFRGQPASLLSLTLAGWFFATSATRW